MSDASHSNHSAGQIKRHADARKRSLDLIEANKSVKIDELTLINDASWDPLIDHMNQIKGALEELNIQGDEDIGSISDMFQEEFGDSGHDLYLKMKSSMDAQKSNFDSNLLLVNSTIKTL